MIGSYRLMVPKSLLSHTLQWYNSGGKCWSSILTVCAGGQALHLQDVVIPKADERGNPMMVSVNITYSFESCFASDCNSTIALSLINRTKRGNPTLIMGLFIIMPSNKIVLKPHSSTMGLAKHFTFQLEGDFHSH